MRAATAVLVSFVAAAAAAPAAEKRTESPFFPSEFYATFTAFPKSDPTATAGMMDGGELGGFPIQYKVTQVPDAGQPPFYGALVHIEEFFTGGKCAIVDGTFKCGAGVDNSDNETGLFVINKTWELELEREITLLLPPAKGAVLPSDEWGLVSGEGLYASKHLSIEKGQGVPTFVEVRI